MKSFGVRLAAGLLTILFGAYAAAVAQKDKQNDPQAWAAQPPSLGKPAMPIAGMDEQSWIHQPAVENPAQELHDLAASAFAPADNSPLPPTESGDVALIQHTEAATEPPSDQRGGFGFAALPASLGAPTGETPQGEASEPESHTLPPASDMMMPLPDWTRQTEPLAPAELQSPAEPQSRAEPQSPAELPSPAEQGVPQDFANNMQLPPSERGTSAPVSDEPKPFAFAEVPNLETEPVPSFERSEPGLAPDLHGNPTNGLRGPSAVRMEGPPAEPAGFPTSDAPRLAQDSPQFASPPRAIPDRSLDPIPNRMANLPTSRFNDAISKTGYAPTVETDPQQVLDAPGDRRLDGLQSPSIVIQKRAPPEVKVGKPATFAVHVQNVGGTDALDVKVHDRIPAGMRLIDATPAPVQQGSLLLWELGTLRVGEERTITLQLIPEAEGELGSVARVTFEAAASVRTRSTRPELKIVQMAPRQVLIGQQLEIELEVSNPGTGEATAVSLQEDVPEGLEHPRGRQLDNLLGNLAPGEVRQQVLRLRAVSPGVVRNTIRLVSEDGLRAEDSIEIEVIAPDLKVDLVGPSRRFLERQATYELQIVNAGTAEATNVEISVGLDRGFTFVSTDYEGSYDPSRHTVTWSLASLPAGVSAKVPLTLLPVEEGNRALTIDARADLGVVARAERNVTVEGFAELTFQITNPGGPIELGAESSYEIVVTNEGSKIDNNIRVQVQLPQGIELISAEGSGNQAQSDGRGLVSFMPLNQLAPGDHARYRIRARGVTPGTHLIRAVVVSDAAPTPVTKEESTLVYADQ